MPKIETVDVEADMASALAAGKNKKKQRRKSTMMRPVSVPRPKTPKAVSGSIMNVDGNHSGDGE